MDSKQLLKSIEQIMDDLANETDEVKISEGFHSYLTTMTRFYKYSLMNQILIHVQKRDATLVAGFKTWQKKFGRHVKKGEKGIAILAPIVYRAEPKKQSAESDTFATSVDTLEVGKKEQATRVHLWFRVVYVFDVSQTEGKPLPEEPNWHCTAKDGELDRRLSEFATKKGYKVEIVDDLAGADGVTLHNKTIKVLRETGSSTLVHELAHQLLGHLDESNTVSRQQAEVEAETVAYVVCQHFNINNGEAAPNYLALWKTTGKEIRACLDRIRGVVTEIICAVEPQVVAEDLGGEA
jgi:hypothetical protein